MCMLCGPVPKVNRGDQGATETGWVPKRTGFLSLPPFARPSGAGMEAAVMAAGLFSDSSAGGQVREELVRPNGGVGGWPQGWDSS